MSSVLRVCALYPDRLDLYADFGNARIIENRCRWRGLDVELDTVRFGDRIPADRNVYLIGGGQDSDLRACSHHLAGEGEVQLRAAAASGAFVIGVGAGYQLLGHAVEFEDETVPGAGLLDVHTTRPADAPRLVGPVATRTSIDRDQCLVGFENHAGRTVLGPTASPLGTVLAGRGNNGDDGSEGAIAGRVFGTYLHGPLFAKNTWLADWVVRAVAGGVDLAPLDDTFEAAAHDQALAGALNQAT